MNRFENLMTDMKTALALSSRYKGLFLPSLIGNVAFFVLIVIFVIALIVIGAGTAVGVAAYGSSDNLEALLLTLSGIGLFLFIMFSLLLITGLVLDIGITGLVVAATEDERPTAAIFFGAVKAHLLPVLGTHIVLFFLYILGFVVLAIPLVIYTFTVGLLSGGWGMVLLMATFRVLLGFWVTIKVADDIGGFESVGENIRFGRRYYWLLILVVYLEISFAGFLPSLLGMIGAAIATFFIGYMVDTYFKIVVLLTYRRHKADGYDMPGAMENF